MDSLHQTPTNSGNAGLVGGSRNEARNVRCERQCTKICGEERVKVGNANAWPIALGRQLPSILLDGDISMRSAPAWTLQDALSRHPFSPPLLATPSRHPISPPLLAAPPRRPFLPPFVAALCRRLLSPPFSPPLLTTPSHNPFSPLSLAALSPPFSSLTALASLSVAPYG